MRRRLATSPGAANSDNNPATGNVLYGTNITTTGGGTAGGAEIGFVGHADQFDDSIQRSVNLLSYTSATLDLHLSHHRHRGARRGGGPGL